MMKNLAKLKPPPAILLALDFRNKFGTDFFLEMESTLLAQAISASSGGAGKNLQVGPPVIIYLWETSETAIVLGVGQEMIREVNLENARDRLVPVLKRRSGGGAVIHSQGNLCFSLILPLNINQGLRDITFSFQAIGSILVKALRTLGVTAQVVPLSDIALTDRPDFIQEDQTSPPRKVSGNAQWRRKNYLLHHGTILLDMDLGLMEKLLKEPEKRPKYRGERSHAKFATNLIHYGISKNMLALEFFSEAIRFIMAGPDADSKEVREQLKECLGRESARQKFISFWYLADYPDFPAWERLEKEASERDLSHWHISKEN